MQNAKHKQMAAICNNVTQLFENSVEFGENKAIINNHGQDLN